MLFMVWVGACWPFTWVMVVGERCSGWCCFQCLVAVVFASRRVPGVGVCVSWLVPGACSGVGWLVVGACACVVGASVGVSWLVCVLWWFRMLTCLASSLSFWFCFLFLLVVWLITVWWLWGELCGLVWSGGVIGLLFLVVCVCAL